MSNRLSEDYLLEELQKRIHEAMTKASSLNDREIKAFWMGQVDSLLAFSEWLRSDDDDDDDNAESSAE